MSSILFVIHTINNGGGAAKMLKYAASIATSYFDDVIVLSINDEHICDKSGLSGSIRTIGLGIKPKPSVLWQLPAILNLRKTIKGIKPDYVLTFVTQVSLITSLASIGLHHKSIISERADPYSMSFIWKFIACLLFKNCDYAIFQLDNARDFYYKSSRNNCAVIPNPYITKTKVEPYYGIRNKTIVSAGRFVSEKAYHNLILAYYHVSKKWPDYSLILYGEGPLLESYKKLVSDLGIIDKVSFPGYIDDVPNTIRKDGIFVLSSHFEGIPNSLIEAMSTGIPCVATDCTPGGPAFLTGNGSSGILVPVNNVEAISEAINTLLNDKQLYNDLQKKSPRVVSLLDEHVIRHKWGNAFLDILKL